MARKKIIIDENTTTTSNTSQTQPTQNISTAVDDYIENKERADQYGAVAKKLNTTIKDYLKLNNLTECSGYTGSVYTTVRKSESFDEDGLLKYLKDSGKDSGVVKTKEYIDYEALESAIYKGDIEAKDLNPYRIIKETVALNIKKGE